MAALRYEISLLVLKKQFTRSLRSLVKYFSTLEEKLRISARPCNILYVSQLRGLQGSFIIHVKRRPKIIHHDVLININHELQKRKKEKMLTSVFYKKKHPRD